MGTALGLLDGLAERTDNWRDGARPAQTACAEVAAAIAEASRCRWRSRPAAMLPDSIRVVELPTDDA